MLRRSNRMLALSAGLCLVLGSCARPSPFAHASPVRLGDVRARLEYALPRPLSPSEPYVMSYTDPYRPFYEEDAHDPSLGRVGLWAAKELAGTLSADHPLRVASDNVQYMEGEVEGFFDTLLPTGWTFDFKGNGFNVTVPFP